MRYWTALLLLLAGGAAAGDELPKAPQPSFGAAERSASGGVTRLRFDQGLDVLGRVRHPMLLFVTPAPAPTRLRLVTLTTDFSARILVDPDPADAEERR